MNLAIFISGSGTTMEAILNAIKTSRLKNVHPVVVVVSSDPKAEGVWKAQNLGCEVEITYRKDYKSLEEFGQQLLAICSYRSVDFISQNGWLPLTPSNVVIEYKNRIINQHPGPLDSLYGNDFGGKGMYGARVICARLAYSWLKRSEYWTEAVIHLVSEEFDKGEIINVSRMKLPQLSFSKIDQVFYEQLKQYTPIIQDKLRPIEHELVIQTLQAIANGLIPSFHRKRRLADLKSIDILKQAKEIAMHLYP
ncbi:MAG: formyltransferase family protein [Candidatus Roizmanbacteria bacterium]